MQEESLSRPLTMPKINLNSPLIDNLEADLRKEFPHLTIERSDSSIRIPPNTVNGFAVELVDAIQEVVPVLGDWVHYGIGEETAIPIFQAGLRGEARLYEISRAGIKYHWRVEFLRNGVWVKEKNDYYSGSIFWVPFLLLCRKQERVLWNDPSRLHQN